MKKLMVEDKDPEIVKIVSGYPTEIKKLVKSGNLADFKQYIKYYEPVTKNLIHAFIYSNYVMGFSGLFGSAAAADSVLEILNTCDISHSLELIEEILMHYGNKPLVMDDETRILVRLLIGTMTVNDVIEEERNNLISEDFTKIIEKYLKYLEEGIDFKDLYYMMKYDYCAFKERKQSNIISDYDCVQKIKGLYCAHSLYKSKCR